MSARKAERAADAIADALDVRGLHAVPGDCADGIVCVVVFHDDGSPHLKDARSAMQDEESERWEEKLIYEGEQIGAALYRLAKLTRDNDAADALSALRSAQDVIAW